MSGNANPRLHMILTAVMAILLARYSGNTDIITGTPIYDQGVDGEFVNTMLTLRIMIEDRQTFKEFLLSVRQTIIEAIENQNYPLHVLPLQAEVSFSSSDLPLFDTVILLENIHNKQYLGNINPNLCFIFNRQENRLQLALAYNPELYHEETIQRIGKNYLVTLNVVLSDLDIKTGAIDIISDEEKTKLLYEFNNTGTEYPRNKTIPQLFTEQVEQTPDNIAVFSHGQTRTDTDKNEKQITYYYLNQQAGHLADH
ncbi:MAG: condensation domain-containing protein [Acidobacteria bacterium]|nr:condensation domain-containing protein [Acidobacteriota bacterium]